MGTTTKQKMKKMKTMKKMSANGFWLVIQLLAFLPMGCQIDPLARSPLSEEEVDLIQRKVESYLGSTWLPSLHRRWDDITEEAAASVSATTDLRALIEHRVDFMNQIDTALEDLVGEIRGTVQVARGESLFDDLAEQRLREAAQERLEGVKQEVIRAVVGVATSADPLSRFSPATMELLQSQFGKHRDRATRILLLRVLLSPGFAGLSEAEQQKLFQLIGGQNDYFAAPARKRLQGWLDDPSAPWDARNPEEQSRLLKGFLVNPPFLPFRSIGYTNPTPSSYRMDGPVGISEEVGFWYFVDGNADGIKDEVKTATRYELIFEESTVTVWMQDNPNGQPQSELGDVVRAIAALPRLIRSWIPGIRVNAAENRTAMATTGSDGLVDLYNRYSSEEIDDTLLHEAGHCFSSKTSHGSFSFAQWERAIAEDQMSVSQYGNKNSHEDFSETINLIVRFHQSDLLDEIEKIIPHRLALLQSFCGDEADCPFRN